MFSHLCGVERGPERPAREGGMRNVRFSGLDARLSQLRRAQSGGRGTRGWEYVPSQTRGGADVAQSWPPRAARRRNHASARGLRLGRERSRGVRSH